MSGNDLSKLHHPPIMVVNQDDVPIGSASLDEIHQQGLLHRIVFVIVKDHAGKILLQRRSEYVATYQNCWDVSAAGHVDEGEDYLPAAKRELGEELGLSGLDLEEIGAYEGYRKLDNRTFHQFNRFYSVVISSNTPLHPNPLEVTNTKWFTGRQVRQLTRDHPDQVTNGLCDAIERNYI